jgi:hypothetical protein
MNTKRSSSLLLAAAMTTSTASVLAQDEAPAGGWSVLDYSGFVEPRLFYFNYSDSNTFLQRYDYQEAWGGNTRNGFYADTDLLVVGADDERNVFVLERNGFGPDSSRTGLDFNTSVLALTGYWNAYKSAAGSLDFLYSPGVVEGGVDPTYFFPAGTNTNSGYVARFNDDSDQTRFTIDRDTYGTGIKLKSGLLPGGGALSLKYDGYSRDGNRFQTYVLGGSNVTGGAARVLQRWRGFDMPVDENMNRATITASGSPFGVQFSYEGSIEKFDNEAPDFQISDFSSNSAFLVPSPNPLFFVPDSTLISNSLRINKAFGATALAAGYALTVLDQDSFSAQQDARGYDEGKIENNTAFLSVNSNALGSVGLEGYVKYHDRDNSSSFPVTGLISATTDQTLGVRIDNIQSLDFGLSANFRPSFWRSSINAGWKRQDTDRDLTWTAVRVPGLNGIQPQRSLYAEESLSDELFVAFVARPMDGVMLRITPSYEWGDDTGLITEPDEAFVLKSSVSYAASAGWLLSGYLNYEDGSNSNKFYTDALTGPVRDGETVDQDLQVTRSAAGASFNKPIGEWINVAASVGWMQTDYATYFLQSSRRRFEAPNNAVAFLFVDQPNYDIDTYVISLTGDWQARDSLRFNGGYTYSDSNGQVASGVVYDELPAVDANVDSAVHTLELGVDYAFSDALNLGVTYTYDYYDDNAYDDLSGSMNSMMIGLSVNF